MSRLIIVTPRDSVTGEDHAPVGINPADVSGFITVEVPTVTMKDKDGNPLKDKDGQPLKLMFTRVTYRAGVAGNPASVKETPAEIATLSA